MVVSTAQASRGITDIVETNNQDEEVFPQEFRTTGYHFLRYSFQDHHEARNGGVSRTENKFRNRDSNRNLYSLWD